MSLPGVKVGPLDPEATREFGQVAAHNSARTLIRLHRQMYPPSLLRQLVRPQDVERSAGLDMDEVREYLGGLAHENGDPLIPEGARVVGANVRGDEATGRVLTFQYVLPSGRVAKWHAPYGEEHLPTSFQQGVERARVKEMKDRGVVAVDEGATHAELLRRELAQSRQENERLRKQLETGDEPAEEDDLPRAAGHDQQAVAGRLEELEQLRRANAELLQRNGELEQLAAAVTGGGGGGVPVGGLESDVENRERQGQAPEGEEPSDDGPSDVTVAGQEPPFEGYDTVGAVDLAGRVKSDDTSDDEVRAILEYERTHANRRTVVSAAEQRLDRASG